MLKIQEDNKYDFLKKNFSKFFISEEEFEDTLNQLRELKSLQSYMESLGFEPSDNRNNFHYLVY